MKCPFIKKECDNKCVMYNELSQDAKCNIKKFFDFYLYTTDIILQQFGIPKIQNKMDEKAVCFFMGKPCFKNECTFNDKVDGGCLILSSALNSISNADFSVKVLLQQIEEVAEQQEATKQEIPSEVSNNKKE